MRVLTRLIPALLVAASASALATRDAAPYQEAPKGIAARLYGGGDCANYRMSVCGRGNTACPATIAWCTYTTGMRGKVSNNSWCGCVTNCTNTRTVKGLVTCGA